MSAKPLFAGVCLGFAVATLAFVMSEESPSANVADTYYDKPQFEHDPVLSAFCDEYPNADMSEVVVLDMAGQAHDAESCRVLKNIGVIK